MPKVKNVIKGCKFEYGTIEEIMIQNNSTGKILFWGDMEGFNVEGEIAEEFKKKVKDSEVVEKQVFNNKKLHMLIEFE